MWAEMNGTTVANGGAGAQISAPTATPENMSNMPGMSMGAETLLTATTSQEGALPTAEGVSTTGSGATFGLSATSSGPAEASAAGAMPMATIHAGAGFAGLLGVVAYGLI